MPLIEPYKDYGQTPVEAFGFHWLTRTDAWHPGGPAANQLWNPRALRKREDGSLEISISAVGGSPQSAEIVSAESMGYGTYEASYELLAPARMRDLHKNIVWGIFPFDWEDTYPGYQEIDIVEDSYWSGYTDMVGKYTLYPQGEDSGKHLSDRVWTASGKGATVRMTWTPGKVVWETWESHLTEDLARTTPITQGGYYSGALTEGIPVPRSQRMHINLWAFRGKGGWESIPATTMHLKSFSYTPWAGSFGVRVGQASAGRLSVVRGGREVAAVAGVKTAPINPRAAIGAQDGVFDAWVDRPDGSILMRAVEDNGDGSVTIKHAHPVPAVDGLYSREVHL
nr:MAG TPA: hydrolase [Caudoviricetes sp.]